jgi:hypothetical protein
MNGLERNILEEWYQESSMYSSPYSLNRIQGIERVCVEKIYKTFKTFFGDNYFRITDDIQNEIRKEHNWLLHLLGEPSKMSCYKALCEICNNLACVEGFGNAWKKNSQTKDLDLVNFRILFSK